MAFWLCLLPIHLVVVQMLVRNFPVAQALHLRTCRETDVEELRDMLVQEDLFHDQALLRIREAYTTAVSICLFVVSLGPDRFQVNIYWNIRFRKMEAVLLLLYLII